MKKIIQIMCLLLFLYGGKTTAQYNVYLTGDAHVKIDKTGGKNGEINFYNVPPSGVTAEAITSETIKKDLFKNQCTNNSKTVNLKFKKPDNTELTIPVKYVYDCDKKSIVFSANLEPDVTIYLDKDAYSDKAPSGTKTSEVIKKKISDDKETLLRKKAKKMAENFTVLKGQNNLVVDKSGNVVVFIDGDGKTLYNDYPKTGRENYDKYKFYVLTFDDGVFAVNCEGEFVPVKLSDEIKTTVKSDGADATGEEPVEQKMHIYESDVYGPYTDSFEMILSKGTDEVIRKTIKLLPVKRISLGTSVISTWLKNPTEIETFTKPNGETTLIANDPTNRAFLGLFLTFHFAPRNLDLEPRYWKERFGISVGTNLSDKSFENFFVGINYEIRNGLYLNGGIHYGRVNTVVGNDNFDFGNDVFEGTLEIRKEWKIGGPYISINIDTDVFAKVFKNIMGPSGTP